jgi:rhodanese-related sulfurtransferase
MKAVWAFAAAGLLLAACSPYEPPRLTATEVHARMAKGEQVLFVDTRPPQAYALEHVDGAVNVPSSRFGTKTDLPKDRWIVLYCT